jgi:hypothetical protein
MANPYKGGEFELVEATLILSTGTPIKLTAGSVLSIAIFEDIYQYSLVGSMVIQDAMNLGSLGPIIGQEYLKLKIKTPSLTGAESIIDFSENALMVTSIDMRVDTGKGVQATVLRFVSREFVVNQRTKVRRNLVGSYSDIVQEMLRKDLDSKKRLNIEPSAETKKIIAPNITPHGVINMAMANAVSQKYSDPTYLFFETCHGFNYRTLGHLYNSKPKLKYSHSLAGTKYTESGSIDILKNISNIEFWKITSTPDIIYNYTVGIYSSEMIVHDIMSKSHQTHTYNYINSFDKERHINAISTNGKDKSYPLANSLSLTPDGKDISSFPSRQFLVPTTGKYIDSSVQDEYYNTPYTSNTPHKTVQQRNSQLGMLETGLQVNIDVLGNTLLGVGDIVECNIPYTATYKTSKNEEFDNLYKGNFLIKKLRHDFICGAGLLSGEHTISMNLCKDNLSEPIIKPSENHEPTSDKSKGTYIQNWNNIG